MQNNNNTKNNKYNNNTNNNRNYTKINIINLLQSKYIYVKNICANNNYLKHSD